LANVLHHDQEQYQRPDEFLMERWDSTSKLYLTEKGEKRHPYSFIPFSGGRRVCLGKTFAELAAKEVSCILLSAFDFEFVDEGHYRERPPTTFSAMETAQIFMRVKLAED